MQKRNTQRFVWMLTLGLFGLGWVGESEAADYQIVVVRAKLFPTKQSRNCWDACGPWQNKPLLSLSKKLRKKKGEDAWKKLMGKNQHKGIHMPDAFVKIRFSNGRRIKTPVRKNTLAPEWGTTTQVALKPNDTIEIEVWDKDLSQDDRIGHFPFRRIPKRFLKRGGAWTLRFQQVYSITLLFVKIQSATRGLFIPGLYEVTVIKAKVKAKKGSGKPWDIFGGRPDPFVILRIGRQVMTTSSEPNTTTPVWHFSKHMYINGNEKLTFTIWDRDIRSHDQIAECQYPIIAQVPLDGKGIFRGRCQLASLFVFRLKKIR